ncbi:hypothetical protein [Flavobacterium frigidarium]|uniref:Uncharacterized protein n=1 Tax=Flavobacterium frigidarium TaxID=99286 RepID=A0ABV4K7V4_9FLAO
MPHKKLFISLLTLFFLQITIAQKLNAIDQKGTKIEIINNKVTTAATAPSNPNSNDVWYDSSTTPTTVKIYNGTAWLIMEHTGTEGSVFFAGADGIITEDNIKFFWNKEKSRLGIGTAAPKNAISVVGKIDIANGEVALPSYTFGSQLGTGMFYKPNSDPKTIGALGFSVGGTESFNIDNSQQVNFFKNVRLAGKLLDGASLAGTAGQVMSSTGTTAGTLWIDPKLVMVINKTNDYILTASDNGKVLTFDKVSLVKLKVPTGLPIGFNISVYQIGDGNVLFMPEESTSVKVYNRLMRLTTAGKNAGAGLLITETNTAHITGDLKK